MYMKFTTKHVWVRPENDGTATIGVTDRAQHTLGDTLCVEQPELGEMLVAGKECAILESLSTVINVCSPLSGEVIVINEAVTDIPDLINQDPQNMGWLFKIRPSNLRELDTLMDAVTYSRYLMAIAH